MVSGTPLSRRLWAEASPTHFRCVYHPFLLGVATGTLPLPSFQEFLKQDAFYLHGFLQAFALAVAKADSPADAIALVKLMQGVNEELELHTSFMESWGVLPHVVDATSATPATRAYVDFLRATAKAATSVAEILAAMVPCARLYAALGQALAGARRHLTPVAAQDFNTYAKWIETYATAEFEASASVMEALLDTIAERDAVDERQLSALYGRAMQLERNFFDAYFPIVNASVILRPTELRQCDATTLTLASPASTSEPLQSASLLAAVLARMLDDTSLQVVDVGADEQDACSELLLWSTTSATSNDPASIHAPTLHVPRVLCIAGSDSGGGAGIQADMKACTALGVFSTSAITAITVQNTHGVLGIHAVPTETLEAQIRCVLEDIGADVIKTGMLASAAIVQCVVKAVQKFDSIPLIVDPVMVSTSGHTLLNADAHACIVNELFPLAMLITPNIPEASFLLGGRSISTVDDMKTAAADLQKLGRSRYVLVKGGHLDDMAKVVDVLFDGTEFVCFESPRIATTNTHGTGCTLASAIAAHYAKVPDIKSAVLHAIRYVHAILVSSQDCRIGRGAQGPMLHWL
ncbi:hypothetical protein SPRG_10795 [Saprolegnia parasitica CBS 223.65]|uniref:Phosphomethylpyrimidine kinase n=1 Tax=Saprolegnia parasitica (strain CBS 223.65) TaxID=695850 RepID=A0A067C387_SAPPC|nr:hypothetical protein SPRG_10795 [Saprolegnia parasitica CBS 223.65]KDO23600.1 hypothetical protein SPRG_10795 [Saprolegnia parasitica CBS 223.65]|eukprot:XP_012205748.1 hypothetical protein SPRG_10795 [Saprolegnia parasitica CBS 223.65]